MLLIVDADPRFLETAEHTLDERGGVLFALNAEQAKWIMGAVGHEFSAALIDLSLPSGNGPSLVREMHHNYPDLPVIAMSGTFKRYALQRAKALGAADVLRKPVTSEWKMAIARAKAASVSASRVKKMNRT
jgi:DNA-binding NtrC family response regulator